MSKIIVAVVAALAAAVAAGTTDVVKQAMSDAYGWAKKAVRRKRAPVPPVDAAGSPAGAAPPAAGTHVGSIKNKDTGVLIVGNDTNSTFNIDRRK